MKFWDFTASSSTCELCMKERKKEKRLLLTLLQQKETL